MGICLLCINPIRSLSAGAIVGIVAAVAALISLLFFIYLRRRRRAKQPTYKPIHGFTSGYTEALTPEAIQEARASTQHLIPSPHPSVGSPRQEYSPGMVTTQTTHSLYASVEDQNHMVWSRSSFMCSSYLYLIHAGSSTHRSVHSRR